jgi:hypothetical protein
MNIVGTLGGGKLVVLYPAFRGDAPGMDFAFGIQRTIARRLEACGRPTLFGVMRTRVERVELDGEGPPPLQVGQIQLAVAETWAEEDVANALVRQFACRWGLVLDMTAKQSCTRLESRVFEADEGGARVIARREFDGENVELPREVFGIVEEAARRTGVRCAWGGWEEMFETGDAIAVLRALRMTGMLSGVEEGVVYDRDVLLGELRGIVDAAVRSGFVIELVAEVLRGLHRQGVSPMHLQGWLRRARSVAGRPASVGGAGPGDRGADRGCVRA